MFPCSFAHAELPDIERWADKSSSASDIWCRAAMAALWTAKAWSRATVEASIRASASNDPTHAVWRVRTFARLTSRASSSEYAAGATASRASVEMKAWRYEPMMRVSSPMPLRSLVISSYAAIVSGVTGTADWRRMSRASTRSRTWETRFLRASTAPRNSGESTAGKYSETSQRGSEETMEVSLDIGPPIRHSIGRPRAPQSALYRGTSELPVGLSALSRAADRAVPGHVWRDRDEVQPVGGRTRRRCAVWGRFSRRRLSGRHPQPLGLDEAGGAVASETVRPSHSA